jgi:hypothetical protein
MAYFPPPHGHGGQQGGVQGQSGSQSGQHGPLAVLVFMMMHLSQRGKRAFERSVELEPWCKVKRRSDIFPKFGMGRAGAP